MLSCIQVNRGSSGQGVIPDRRYSPRAERLTKCISWADSRVWMEEDFRITICALSVFLGAHFLFMRWFFMGEIFSLIQNNLRFFSICVAIALAVIACAKLAERFLLKHRTVSVARRVSIIGMCTAIAIVLYILDFPVPFLAPPFYKLDFSEIPVLLCGFFLGPSAGVICLALKVLLKLLLQGTTTAFVGDLANFVVGTTLVLPAVIIYHLNKSKKSALIGLVTGTVSMAALGSLFNAVYLIPEFSRLFGLPLESIIGMGAAIHASIDSVNKLALLCVAPLNLVKGAAVSVLTMLLYKHVARPLFREK
mgnify:CR=1 FL=1